MEFSLMTEPQIGGTYDELLELARWAEQAGMASFARSDHYYSERDPKPDATDAFATLAGLARETSTIRLAVLVTPITFRHPAVIAKNAATIDQMSGGRLDLGVGTGWLEMEHDAFGIPFPPASERFGRLEEALGYLHCAFSADSPPFEGRWYRLQAESRPIPSGIRIIVGGSGARRTPTLAGAHGDEYNHFIATPEEIGPKIARMRAAAERVGRDPGAIRVSVMGPIVAGRDEQDYREALSRAASDRGLEASAFETRLAGGGVPHGPPEQISEHLGRLSDVGVDRMYVQWLDPGDLGGLERTWEAIRPSGDLVS